MCQGFIWPLTNKTPTSPVAKDAILFMSLTNLWPAALYVRSSFFFFLFEAQGTTVLTVKVFTLGGFMFTLPRAQKSNIDTQTCHRVDECVRMSDRQTERKKITSEMKWGEDDGSSVWWHWELGGGLCYPWKWPQNNLTCCHFSSDTRCLDGVNRKVVCNEKCVCLFVCVCGGGLSFQRGKKNKLSEWVSDRGDREVKRACPWEGCGGWMW